MERTNTRLKVRIAVVVAVALAGVVLGITWLHLHDVKTTLAELEQSVSTLERQLSTMRKAQIAAQASAPVSPLLLHYQLDLPGRGEVFPAMAATKAPEYWPVAILSVTNTANRPAAQVISAEILGWSRRDEHSLVLGPRETRQLRVQPELLPRAYENDEIRQATLEVRATSQDSGVLFAQSRTVLIHGGSDIYWGRRFANAQVAARWVTPHDRAVLELVSQARTHAPGGRLAGYGAPNRTRAAVAADVRRQSLAVYRALQRSGLTYVSSVFVMGDYVNEAQRIRLPRETLRLRNANCMDVAVVFASAMENLGMQPLLIIVPGHALAGVRLGYDSNQVLYLDLTVLPRGSFESAIARADQWLRRTPREQILTVDVNATRAIGIYPLVQDDPGQTAMLSPTRFGGEPTPPAGRAQAVLRRDGERDGATAWPHTWAHLTRR